MFPRLVTGLNELSMVDDFLVIVGVCDYRDLFVCVAALCPHDGFPQNGFTDNHQTWYVEGDYVRYRCLPGYSMVGKESRQCGSNAQLDGEKPQCVFGKD